MFYTIGEMAQKLNVAPSTLRYYEIGRASCRERVFGLV